MVLDDKIVLLRDFTLFYEGIVRVYHWLLRILILSIGLGTWSFKAEANPNNQPNNLPNIEAPKVILFVKVDKDYPFWKSGVLFAQAVADALSLDFEARYIPTEYRDRFNSIHYIKLQLNEMKVAPTLVMSAFIFGAEKQLLELLAKKDIPFISLNSFISKEQFRALGHPREHYPLWLGHISPNDILAGKQLIKGLLKRYRDSNQCEELNCGANIFGFTGLPYAAVSQQRALGVKQEVEQDPLSQSYDVVPANWRRHIVFEKMQAVLYRYKDIDIFWAASDNMAWGIVDGIQKYKYKKKVLVGSFDWSPKTVPYIQNGNITFSLGGHFLEAGLALILYYDFINGIDFAEKHGPIIETTLSELNNSNVDKIGPFLTTPKWDKDVIINYSKFNNPRRSNYLFEPLEIISQQLN